MFKQPPSGIVVKPLAGLNKRTNKTTTRRDNLQENVVRKSPDRVDKTGKSSARRRNSRSAEREKKQREMLSKHNTNLSESHDGMANVTDEEEVHARQLQEQTNIILNNHQFQIVQEVEEGMNKAAADNVAVDRSSTAHLQTQH